MEYLNEYVLDLHEAGYWMARWHEDTYPIGRSKEEAARIIARLNASHRPNLEVAGRSLMVCWNDHDKGVPCRYEVLVSDAA